MIGLCRRNGPVMPAKVGTQRLGRQPDVDSRPRGNDKSGIARGSGALAQTPFTPRRFAAIRRLGYAKP